MVFWSRARLSRPKAPRSVPSTQLSTSHLSPLHNNDHFIREQHCWHNTSRPKSLVLFSSDLATIFQPTFVFNVSSVRPAPTRRHLRQQCQRYSPAKLLLLPFRRYSRLCLFLHHSQALQRADPSSLLRGSAKLPRTSPAFLGKEFENYKIQTSYY
jgi:hypothetical protein